MTSKHSVVIVEPIRTAIGTFGMEASGAEHRFAHPPWPYDPKFRRVNGWRMHYVDEGTGDPVVLLHGNPAWGFLYRKLSSR